MLTYKKRVFFFRQRGGILINGKYLYPKVSNPKTGFFIEKHLPILTINVFVNYKYCIQVKKFSNLKSKWIILYQEKIEQKRLKKIQKFMWTSYVSFVMK